MADGNVAVVASAAGVEVASSRGVAEGVKAVTDGVITT